MIIIIRIGLSLALIVAMWIRVDWTVAVFALLVLISIELKADSIRNTGI